MYSKILALGSSSSTLGQSLEREKGHPNATHTHTHTHHTADRD